MGSGSEELYFERLEEMLVNREDDFCGNSFTPEWEEVDLNVCGTEPLDGPLGGIDFEIGMWLGEGKLILEGERNGTGELVRYPFGLVHGTKLEIEEARKNLQVLEVHLRISTNRDEEIPFFGEHF